MSATTLLRKATKAAVLPAGLASRRRDGDVVALLYHRVGDEPSEIELDAGVFDRQMAELASDERCLTIDEAIDEREAGVVVTFDDGTADFHGSVLPVIERHRVPVVLYLATGMVAGESIALEGALTWSQLSEAVGTGLVTIGSHTHSHVDLAAVDARTADEEMRRSRDLIEERLGVPCRHLAYPWAVANEHAERSARRLFASAALDPWEVNRPGFDAYRFGRIPILRSDGHFFFRRKVRGEMAREAVIYRALGRGPWRRTA